MTTDADERPKDETALEAEVSEAPAQTPDEAPSQTAAEAPAPVEEAPAAEASVEAPVEPATETPAPTAEAPAADAPAEPATEAPVPAAEAPVADAPAEPTTESPAPTAEAPTADAPAEPATEAPAEAAEAPTADAPAEPTAQAPAPAAEAPTADAPVEPTAQAPAPVETPAPTDGTPAEAGAQTPGPKDEAKPAAKKPRRRKPRERRKPVPETPRARVPLPLDELRDASRSTMNLFGPRRALRDALGVLAPREKQELNVLIAADEDHRPRARNIANGSIGAGRIDKAMAATIVSMAPQEELWGVLLDKEQAAQKLGRIREAKQRDKQRADRAKERANRTDRVSREDMAKATDGRVGATIRFVTADEKRDRRDKDTPEKKPWGGGSVLDRLGY